MLQSSVPAGGSGVYPCRAESIVTSEPKRLKCLQTMEARIRGTQMERETEVQKKNSEVRGRSMLTDLSPPREQKRF